MKRAMRGDRANGPKAGNGTKLNGRKARKTTAEHVAGSWARHERFRTEQIQKLQAQQNAEATPLDNSNPTRTKARRVYEYVDVAVQAPQEGDYEADEVTLGYALVFSDPYWTKRATAQREADKAAHRRAKRAARRAACGKGK